MSRRTVTYVGAVRAALAGAGDPGRAAQQQAYMKSALPFVGLGAPALKALLRPLLVEHRFIDRGSWEAAVLELWDDATHHGPVVGPDVRPDPRRQAQRALTS